MLTKTERMAEGHGWPFPDVDYEGDIHELFIVEPGPIPLTRGLSSFRHVLVTEGSSEVFTYYSRNFKRLIVRDPVASKSCGYVGGTIPASGATASSET